VHKELGDADKSAEHCHTTLSKQLKLNAYNPLEWAINAATLSSHFLANSDYESAKMMIVSAKSVLEANK